jgi:ATP-binding cassette, subfamily G (WHITE), member 2, SNQ2
MLKGNPVTLIMNDPCLLNTELRSAWNLVRFLRKLADQGQAILCTIHQPSSLLFESFDRLLLLKKGGETAYFGEIGHDSEVIREYFGRHGAHCPPNSNPAEYMLEAIGAGITPRVGNRDWKDIWLDSPEYVKTMEEIAAIKKAALEKEEPNQKLMTTCEQVSLADVGIPF